MITMRLDRVVGVLQELSNRLGGLNSTMDTLQEDYKYKRMASMQIRKAANKCREEAEIAMKRFLAISETNQVDKDWAVMTVFYNRRMKFYELEKFFL